MIISCSSVGKRVVPNSAVVSRDVVMNNSIEEVKKKFSETVGTKHVGLYKKGNNKGSFFILPKFFYSSSLVSFF